MFDANMRHLPNGHKFFAETYTVDKDSYLYCVGVRESDKLIYCVMLDNDEENDHDNPLIRVYKKDDTHFITRSQEDGDELWSTWIVYAGDATLEGFLPQDKATLIPIAKQILKELQL